MATIYRMNFMNNIPCGERPQVTIDLTVKHNVVQASLSTKPFSMLLLTPPDG